MSDTPTLDEAEETECYCLHELWQHSGMTIGWPCCAPDCACRAFVQKTDDPPPAHWSAYGDPDEPDRFA